MKKKDFGRKKKGRVCVFGKNKRKLLQKKNIDIKNRKRTFYY